MIVYSAIKSTFLLDVESNSISSKIGELLVKETGRGPNRAEQMSYNNSLQFMRTILEDRDIPNNAGIAIEYQIPRSSKRVDFIITGRTETKRSAILIELKQWSDGLVKTDRDAVLEVDFYSNKEVNHPSYQAWSYASLLEDYNSAVREKEIGLKPCAYLHNYSKNTGVVNDPFYGEWLKKAPVFFSEDVDKLRQFIKNYVKHGDEGSLMYEIDKGKIKPSKSLADSLSSMLAGNKEFVLIDTQKIIYEKVLSLAKIEDEKKRVIVIKGGPGTGKSVVAINLLVDLTNKEKVVQYVTKNSAPREVFKYMLTGKLTNNRIDNLFTGSGSFYNAEKNIFDVLIVDEAHRLNEKSGLFRNKGENQISEIIKASKTSVFFLDEDQKIDIKDIGSIDEVKKWIEHYKTEYYEYELESQFRCNGSDGYLAWLDNTLQIRDTANFDLSDIDYDFRVIDDPGELHKMIIEKNKTSNKSRMLAGYCWAWDSKNNPKIKDITLSEYSATWNLSSHGLSWLIRPDSVNEVGCIHTSQGLDLDYVGVIIGPDLVVRNNEVITDVTKRAKSDRSVNGRKQMLKDNPIKARKIFDRIIKNTYKVLMSRGMKGCYIYCVDKETQEYFKSKFSYKYEK